MTDSPFPGSARRIGRDRCCAQLPYELMRLTATDTTAKAVLTGALMTPLSSTSQLWLFHFAEWPRPVVLPHDFDVVRTGMGVGVPAIEALREQEAAVGPVLCCMAHRMLLIPVAATTADWWHAPHSLCRRGGQWVCADFEEQPLYTTCAARFWIVPAQGRYATTAHADLHHSLSLTRSRLRTVAA